MSAKKSKTPPVKELHPNDTQVQVSPKTINFNTMMAYYDIHTSMFIVNFGNVPIPLTTLISIIISVNGTFKSLGMSYNPSTGHNRQELAFMYEVLSDSNFSQLLTDVLKQYSSNKS